MTNEELALRGALQDLNGALWSFGDMMQRNHDEAIGRNRAELPWWSWTRWYWEARFQWQYHSFMWRCPEIRRPQ